MIKYLGSKRLLVPRIVGIVEALRRSCPIETAVDLFSGTARVGHALKRAGLRVLSNDHNAYAETLARCYVAADAEEHAEAATRLIAELNALPGSPGYFTETFCEKSRFFQPHNGARVDAIRESIAARGLPPELEAILLVALMEAADRVDSTAGVQMAYLKTWAPRSFNDLELRLPELLPRAATGKGEAHGLDALEGASLLKGDLVYLDPPYNQHKYLGNYHIWESLVRWDKPETYGVAHKRIDCKARQSSFNSKPRIHDAMAELLARLTSPCMIVSFSDEGFIGRDAMEAMLGRHGHVTTLEVAYRRYVGATIGVYNPRGEKVGAPGRRHNTERLFIVTPEPLKPDSLVI